ncbi:MAG: hypothetical protein H7A45_19070 [Verrucomicrobiales bacterium]|nr:hypothetical protein [Verrucomicrobiales bacterium]MCP5525825.1 hypothetical protein [Verrucomicrobiales bacterium]
MELDEAQKRQVAAWLAAGSKLAEIQTRIEQEFGARLTYMEVKLLVSELDLLPKDPEPAAVEPAAAPAPAAQAPAAGNDPRKPNEGAAGVSVTVDQLARPGALVSGQVTFSDGQTGSWYVDQLGRLGLSPAQKGYRPSAADMQEFQGALEQELARLGM